MDRWLVCSHDEHRREVSTEPIAAHLTCEIKAISLSIATQEGDAYTEDAHQDDHEEPPPGVTSLEPVRSDH